MKEKRCKRTQAFFSPQSDEGEGAGGGSEGERDKFPCGECGKEVRDNDEAIYCESGCEQWYHRWVWPNHVTHFVAASIGVAGR